jgi:hypothetical protein
MERLGYRLRYGAALLLLACAQFLTHPAFAQSRNLAPGFTTLPKSASVLLLPTDVELYALSAGGVSEPRADWTEAATKHMGSALKAYKARLGVDVIDRIAENDALTEVNALHGAVARAITIHHFGLGLFRLPTKEGQLDWSLGDAVRPLREQTNADYALFTWVRDSYATSSRIASSVAITVLGALVGVAIVPQGGQQIGYASLVDLRTGQVIWFNRLQRPRGDLREAEKAAESIDALLYGFPEVK